MSRRIIGLETEYSLCFFDRKENKLFGSAYASKLIQAAAKELGFSEWLENGGRFYIDHGDHPEYATPECTSALELAKYDKAGERIMEKICDFLNSQREDQGIFYFHKDNSDRKGSSFGSHENYLVRGGKETPPAWLLEMLPILAAFLATRQIFCGAGKIGVEPVIGGTNYLNFGFGPYSERNGKAGESEEDFEPDLNCVFQISQRADFIDCLTAAAPHGGPKGFFSEKGDNHCPAAYHRLHVICGDSNMSEYSAWLKIATTLLVISMLEDEFITPFSAGVPVLASPISAVKEISRDVSLKKKVFLRDGGQMSALEIQKWFLEKANEYYLTNPDSEIVDSKVIVEWADTLDKLEKSPRLLAKKIDWLMKYELIKRYAAENNLDWRDSRVLTIDLEYHNIQRNRGIYYFLEQQGEAEKILDEDQIREAMENPPPEGRAVLRSAFVRFAKKFGLQSPKIDWSGFGRIQNDVEIRDPWNFSYGQAVKLLKCLAGIMEELQFNRKSGQGGDNGS
jgi:proteasome accessory factor A